MFEGCRVTHHQPTKIVGWLRVRVISYDPEVNKNFGDLGKGCSHVLAIMAIVTDVCFNNTGHFHFE